MHDWNKILGRCAEGVKRSCGGLLRLNIFPESVILVETAQWLWLRVKVKLKFCAAMMHDDEIC